MRAFRLALLTSLLLDPAAATLADALPQAPTPRPAASRATGPASAQPALPTAAEMAHIPPSAATAPASILAEQKGMRTRLQRNRSSHL